MKSNSSDRLNELMNYFGIKQADIVQRTGLPKSAISMYANGNRKAPQNKLTIIADAYGVDEVWLMGYDVPMFKNEESKDVEIGSILENLLSINDNKLERLIRIFNELDEETKDAFILIGEKMLLK